MHYVDIRCDEATQKEHREVADQCKAILTDLFPSIYGEKEWKINSITTLRRSAHDQV
jgi:thymidylate synthase ThyX